MLWTRKARTRSNIVSREVIAGARCRPAAELLWRDELPADIVTSHYVAGDIHPVCIREVIDAQYGGLGLIRIGDDLFAPADCYPDYLQRMVSASLREQRADPWCGLLFSRRRRKVRCADPLLAALHPNLVYGHFLLEMLPRLLVAEEYDTTGASLALSTRSPAWLAGIVSIVAPSRKIVWFDSAKEVIVAPKLIVPSSMQGAHHHLHPRMRDLISAFKIRIGIQAPRPATKRLYLSRSRHPNVGAWHRLDNEAEIERVFEAAGFEILHPQEIGFKEQIERYDEAAVIAGEFSSALHNSLWARPGCRVLALNWINWHQSRIVTLMEQSVAYLPTETGFIDWQHQARGFQCLKVDCDSLRRKLVHFEISDTHSERMSPSAPSR